MGRDERRIAFAMDSSMVRRITWTLVAIAGGAAAVVALTRTDDDPIGSLLRKWPVVLIALALYLSGMCVYATSWAVLFPREDNRRLIGLGFIISQPVKYLPGGIAQPIGQIALAAQASGEARRAVVSFPVHVLINVVAAISLGAPLLFVADLPSWAGWLIVVVPITWTALNRRWMAALLGLLGRLHARFRVADDLPSQRSINTGFALGLVAHGTMFLAFGVLTASSIPGWSVFELATAYAVAWLIGYVAVPAPAGLGAREAVLAVLLGASLSTADVVRISAVHRIATLVVELALLLVALVATQSLLGRRAGFVDRAVDESDLPDTNTTDSRT